MMAGNMVHGYVDLIDLTLFASGHKFTMYKEKNEQERITRPVAVDIRNWEVKYDSKIQTTICTPRKKDDS